MTLSLLLISIQPHTATGRPFFDKGEKRGSYVMKKRHGLLETQAMGAVPPSEASSCKNIPDDPAASPCKNSPPPPPPRPPSPSLPSGASCCENITYLASSGVPLEEEKMGYLMENRHNLLETQAAGPVPSTGPSSCGEIPVNPSSPCKNSPPPPAGPVATTPVAKATMHK